MFKFLLISIVFSAMIGIGFPPTGHSSSYISWAGSATTVCSFNVCNYDLHNGVGGSIMADNLESLNQWAWRDGRPQDLVLNTGDVIAWWVGLGNAAGTGSLQAGYCLGSCPDNVFHTTPVLYLESKTLAGVYTFTILGDAPYWTTHSFQVWFTSGTGHVKVDGSEYTVPTDLTNGYPQAMMENHQKTTLGWNGYFTNLQYYDGSVWYRWGMPHTNCFFDCNYFQQQAGNPYCTYSQTADWFATDGTCHIPGQAGSASYAKKNTPLVESATLTVPIGDLPPPQPPFYVDFTIWAVIGTLVTFAVLFLIVNRFVLAPRKGKKP